MVSSPYAKRQIVLTFKLGAAQVAGNVAGGIAGSNTGAASGFSQMTVSGLRTFVQVSQAMTPQPSQCQIRVFGLTLDQINTLTKTGSVFQVRNNQVAVQAGDDQSGLATIFNGIIYWAVPEFGEQPETSFLIKANPGGTIQLKPTPAVSFPKSVAADVALKQILQPAGVTLEANGTMPTLASPYFPGTVWQQAMRALAAGDLFGYYDGVAQKLAVWPKTGNRSTSPITISPATGMIGYPEYMENQIRVRTLFDPSFQNATPGTQIQVQSQLTPASGKFVLNVVDYNLSSEAPGGPWEMVLTAAPTGTE
jgi:hypothetical protein